MNAVAKALWYIESHSEGALTLDDVARAAHVSRFHLARIFAMATGYPVMAYLRARRLSKAACALAGGAPDILALALASGYHSHEAFTRAFREQFGSTPDAVRAARTVDNLVLVEALRMDTLSDIALETPLIEQKRGLLIAGLSAPLSRQNTAGIPAQWQRFSPYLGRIPGQVGQDAYGVVLNADSTGNMEYLCGVEVDSFARCPSELRQLEVKPRQYAVFQHRGHISAIGQTWNAIWNDWLPGSGHQAADAPVIEHYTPAFNPQTGNGGLSLWVPID